MNIYNLDRIISESIKKAIYLMEAERVVCQGNEEWIDFNNEVKKFITLVETFDISFKSLIGKINNGGDLSNHARNVLKLLPVLTIVYSKKENMDSDVVNFIRDFKNQ